MNWDLPKLKPTPVRRVRSLDERRREAVRLCLEAMPINTIINLFLAVLNKEQARDIVENENLEVPKH